MTKTHMLMNSAFLNRGYHLQDNVKTKEKINLLFAQKQGLKEYFPESKADKEKWYSDYRGIIIEIIERDYSDK